MHFSNKNRQQMIQQLISEKYDVLIIGGGITGAGIALDATARGLKVALVEMQDFAAGTSSRSTKLVHGGLRYLKQLEFRMVSEVGKERAIVYENGPHVTTPIRMMLPFYQSGTFRKWSTSLGLKLYDFLANVKKEEQRIILSKEKTLAKAHLLRKDGLLGSGYYVEYRTDDARLTIEVIKAAYQKGAAALNYCKVDKLLYENEKVIGALVKDQLSGEKFEIFAKKMINATGPWVDAIREIDHSRSEKSLKLSKGVHVVIDGSIFPLKQAVYFDTPDGRMVFAIPREGKTYVGTTDTFFEGDLQNPQVTENDRQYLINAIHFMFPSLNISENHIESSWAGIRPLISEEGKVPSAISRKDEIWESSSGLITIAGGKLTGYRKMAEMIVDYIADQLSIEGNRNIPPCSTKIIPISGGNLGGSKNLNRYISQKAKNAPLIGISTLDAIQLTKLYGSNVDHLFNIISSEKETAAKYDLPLILFSKLTYAIDHEMAVTPIDFFYRRTGALLFHIDLVKNTKEKVINYMSDEFSWDYETKMKMLHELQLAIEMATGAGNMTNL